MTSESDALSNLEHRLLSAMGCSRSFLSLWTSWALLALTVGNPSVAAEPVVRIQVRSAKQAFTLDRPEMGEARIFCVRISNRGTTPILNPQVYLPGRPVPYTWSDILPYLETRKGSGAIAHSAWVFVCSRFFHHCSAGITGPLGQDGSVSGRQGYYGTELIRDMNAFGFGCCDNVAHYLAQLWDQLGLKARLQQMPFHTVPEVFYEGRWHMFDPDHRTFYLHPDGKTVASVEDLWRDPELIALNADTMGRDPVGFLATDMIQGYLQGQEQGQQVEIKGPFPSPPSLRLQPGETVAFWASNLARKVIRYDLGNPIGLEDVHSAQFTWDVPLQARPEGLIWTDVEPGKGGFRAKAGGTGRLSLSRTLPFPLHSLEVYARFRPDTPGEAPAGGEAFTHRQDLTPATGATFSYTLTVDIPEGTSLEAVRVVATAQTSRLLLPPLEGQGPFRLLYKDDSPPGTPRTLELTTGFMKP